MIIAVLLALCVSLVTVTGGRAAGPLTHLFTSTTAAGSITSADLHFEKAGGIEVDLAITQTRDDCGVPLNGETCLRYSVMKGDTIIQSGDGLIPDSDVLQTGSTITLSFDSSSARYHRILGGGGPISVTWTANSPKVLWNAAIKGRVVGEGFPTTDIHASVLRSSSP